MPSMPAARSSQPGWVAWRITWKAANPTISTASRPAPPNIRIGPQLGP